MGQSTAFDTINVPHVCGLKLSVSITSPSSASEDVAEWLGEISEAVSQIDRLVFADVLDPADRRGLISFKSAGEKLLTLTTTIQRELAITKGVVDALTRYLPDTCEPVRPSPVARHVALMRGEWRDRVNLYDQAEALDITGFSEQAQDEAFDVAGELLDALVATPVPDLAALAEKMRLMLKTGSVQADGYFASLIRDVETLAEQASVPADLREVEA